MRRFWRSFTQRSVLFVVPVLAVGLLAAACGGGEKVTPTPTRATPTPSTTRAPQPTATTAPQPTATSAAPQATATPTPRPQATPTTAPTGPSGAMRVAVSTFWFDSLDPIQQVVTSFGTLAAGMYDWLAWHTPDSNLSPGAATKWEMAPDGKSWTFTLRDMPFHDGSKLTAEDVKFTVERAWAPESRGTNATVFKRVQPRGEVVNSTTVRVVTDTAQPLLIYLLSARDGSEGAIVNKKQYDTLGAKEAALRALGSGPWKLVHHEVGTRYLYEAWDRPHPFRPTPRYKTLEIVQIPEESTRVAMVRTNAAGFIEMSQGSVAPLRSAGFPILALPGASPGGVMLAGAFNPGAASSPLANKQFRQALATSVNQKEIVDTILGGAGDVMARWVVLPGTLGYDPTWRPYQYNPDQARTLLRQAGLERASITIVSTTLAAAPWLPQLAEAVAGYWSSLGLRATLEPRDAGTVSLHFREAGQPNLAGRAFVFYFAPTSTNLTILNAWYHSAGVVKLLNSKEWDDIHARASSTLDEQERVRLVRQLMDIVYNEYVSIPVAMAPLLFGAAKDVKGWTPIFAAYPGMSYESITK